MTNTKPASGTATGLPALYSYLDDLQTEAMHLGELLKMLDFLDHENPRQTGDFTTLITLSRRLCHKLNEGLDAVNLPKVEGAK